MSKSTEFFLEKFYEARTELVMQKVEFMPAKDSWFVDSNEARAKILPSVRVVKHLCELYSKHFVDANPEIEKLVMETHDLCRFAFKEYLKGDTAKLGFETFGFREFLTFVKLLPKYPDIRIFREEVDEICSNLFRLNLLLLKEL